MRPPAKPQAKPIGELVGPALDPVIRKRGLAKADILAWWPDIVGKAYAGRTRPERIRWPRASDPGGGPGGRAATLVIRCDPSVALQLTHESGQIRERLNRFLGFQAVGAVRIVQHPIGAEPEKPPKSQTADADRLALLEAKLKPLDEPLAQSLKALGRNVLARA